jgi:hypothetical protein
VRRPHAPATRLGSFFAAPGLGGGRCRRRQAGPKPEVRVHDVSLIARIGVLLAHFGPVSHGHGLFISAGGPPRRDAIAMTAGREMRKKKESPEDE